ncbi:MAG: hypothetical protein WBW31_05935, partial [Candidatus Sulfotelmatobacter sp.]
AWGSKLTTFGTAQDAALQEMRTQTYFAEALQPLPPIEGGALQEYEYWRLGLWARCSDLALQSIALVAGC